MPQTKIFVPTHYCSECPKAIPRANPTTGKVLSNTNYARKTTCSATCATVRREKKKAITKGLQDSVLMIMDAYDYFNLGKCDLLRVAA
jgi:hypothetical protein